MTGIAPQVSFPGVGELVRNRAGRVEFVFEQQLVDALELGLAPVSSSVGDSSQKRAVAMEDVHARTLWRHASWHYWVSLLGITVTGERKAVCMFVCLLCRHCHLGTAMSLLRPGLSLARAGPQLALTR